MPQRALWNGFLKLSLVSCPIALFAGTATEKRLSFRRVNRTTGNALRQRLVDAVTGESVAASEVGRGYQIGEERFLVVEDQEIEDARKEARARPFASATLQDVQVVPLGERSALRKSKSRREEDNYEPGVLANEDVEPEAFGEQNPTPVPRPLYNKTIDLDRFIELGDLDIRFVDSPYYIIPRDETGEEAFAVIREAMRDRSMAGMGRVILQRRERHIVVVPRERGLLGLTLRYAHEIRDTSEFFGAVPDIDLPDDMVEMAGLLIDRKTGAFDPALLEDRYRTVLVERLKQKSVKAMPVRRAAAHEQNVINLMAALKRSVGRDHPGKRSPTTTASRRAAARSKRAPMKKGRASR